MANQTRRNAGAVATNWVCQRMRLLRFHNFTTSALLPSRWAMISDGNGTRLAMTSCMSFFGRGNGVFEDFVVQAREKTETGLGDALCMLKGNEILVDERPKGKFQGTIQLSRVQTMHACLLGGVELLSTAGNRAEEEDHPRNGGVVTTVSLHPSP